MISLLLNLLFYIFLILTSTFLAVGFVSLSQYLDHVLFQLKLDEATLSDRNWFLKYELYRKGVGKCLENQEFTEK